jgi:DNA polymerase III delta subunit
MLYLFHGTDTEKARAKAFAWLAASRAKAPDASYVRLGADEITESALDEVVQSQGLFFSKMLVLLDDPFARAESGELVLERLPAIAQSKNPIAILAPKLLAARAKKLEAAAEKAFVLDRAQKKAARGFNSALVNALAARDRAALWKELQKAERQGDVPEMLHGLLHWKARDLMQKGGRGWSEEEARNLSRQLIELLSDSRSGDLPLSLQLERFALSL